MFKRSQKSDIDQNEKMETPFNIEVTHCKSEGMLHPQERENPDISELLPPNILHKAKSEGASLSGRKKR